MKIDVYSDVSCPWCYVGKRRLQSALASVGADDVEVTFRPYLLDPGAPEEARPLKDHLRDKFGPRTDGMLSNVTGVAAKEGITMNWDDALSVSTLTAHRLMWLARTEYDLDTLQNVADRLFEAHFTNGLDVANHEVLASIAEEAGMDRARVERFLASDEGLAEVQQEIENAQSMGITAVPTFIFEGQYAVQGAQSKDTFVQVIEEVRKLTAEAVPEEEAVGSCENGSCGF